MAAQTVSKKVSLAAGATTINQPTVTVTSTIALFVGAVLEHPNIPAGTTVTAITSFTGFTMSANATATGSALTIVALNPDSVNIDEIALYGAATVIQKWSSDDTLTINDGITVNVTTNQTKYWKTITINYGKLLISNSSTVLGNAITWAMGRGSAATVNALTTTSGLASVEIQGNWISLGTGTGSAGQTVIAPFTDYIPMIEVETATPGVYEIWTNITGAYGETTEITQGGLEKVSNGKRGNFFVQSEAAPTYVKHFTKGTGSTVNTSRIVTCADTTGIVPGASVTGTGITANSVVQRVINGTTFEVNITPTTSAGPNTFTFVNPYKAQLTSTLTFGNGTNGNIIPAGRNIRCANIMITDLTPANIMTAVNNLGCSFVLDKGNFTANIALFDESYANFTQAQSVNLTHCGFSVPFLISECYNFNASYLAFALQSVRRLYTTYWLARDLRTGQTLSWSYINGANVSNFEMAVDSNTLYMLANPSITSTPSCLSLSYTSGATFSKANFYALRPFRVYNSAILCSAVVNGCTFTDIGAFGLGGINFTTSSENTVTRITTSENMFSYISGIPTSVGRIGTDPVTQAKLIDNTKYYFKVRSFRDWSDRSRYYEGRVVSATPYIGGRFHPWQFGVVNIGSTNNTAYWTRREPVFATVAYALYRSTTPGFTARDATTLQWSTATAATVTYVDNVAGNLGAPVNGTTYYYVFRKYNSGLTVANCSGTSGQFTLTTSNNFNTARGTVINCSAPSGSTHISCITGNFITSGIIPGMEVSGTGIQAGTKVLSVPDWNQMILNTPTTQALAGVTLTFGVAVGMLVTGTNIGANARISSIDSNTQITLNVAHTGTVSAATATISDITESPEQEVYTHGASATAVNYCFQANDQTSATWTKSGITPTAATGGYAPDQMPLVAGTAPTVATDRLVSTTTPGTSTMAVPVTTATQYTASLYVRCDPTAAIPTVAGILGFGTATQAFTANGKWQRVSVTFTSTTTTHNFVITINTTGQTLYVAGAMVNLGATALPPIDTTTVAVTLNPAAQEIIGMIPFCKGDGGESTNSGIEIRLASAPAGTHWSEIYMGTTSNFTPSSENMIASTWDAGTVGFSLTNANKNTITDYVQLGCGGRIVNQAYLRGSSDNKFINSTYNYNYTAAVPINAASLSNNNLFHNWNLKNFRNATATNYVCTALNDCSGITFQNMKLDTYDNPLNTQFANCILKGLSAGNATPAVTTTTRTIGSTTDSPAIAYSAVYDTIFSELYNSETTGILHIAFNASLKTQKPYTLSGAAFANSGKLYFPSAGSYAEYIWPHKIFGVSGFRKIRPFLNGLDLGNDNTVLFGLKVEVAVDTGSGYSAYVVATPDNLSSLSVSAANGFYLKIKLTALTFMKVGTVATQFVVGETINGQTSGATAVVDGVEAFGTVANTITLSSVTGTFIATENIRQGATVRAPNVATNTFALGPSFTSYIDGLEIFTNVDQSVLYPSNVVTLTLTGISTGSDVVIYQAGTTTILQNSDSISGTTNTYTYENSSQIDVGVFKAGYIPFFIRNYTLPISNASLPVAQVIDRAYLT